jgi:hypothetical protein
MTWVTKQKYAELTGLTVRAQEGRIRRMQWRRGVEYAVIDGVTMVNLDAVEARNAERAALQRHEVPMRRLRAVSIQRLT